MNALQSGWIQNRPHLSPELAGQITAEQFGITAATVRNLPGERDQNFYLQAGDGREYVLKVANAQESRENLALQNQLLQYLAHQAPDLNCSRVVPAVSGETILSIRGQAQTTHDIRLLTHLPGRSLAQYQPHPPELLESAGRFLGRLDAALTGFSHPAAHRPFHWRVRESAGMIRRHLAAIGSHSQRTLVRHFLGQFERHTLPLLSTLRSGIIHNDANDYNLLVGEDDQGRPFISGLIDFGDVVYAPLVCEPAVAAAYVILDKEEPLAAAASLLKGYHQVCPLLENEVALLYELMTIRLCLSVTLSAYQQQLRPDDPYLSVSEAPAWTALENLAGLEPAAVENLFRAACSLP
jgi:Ser/Thr protein kinase RdoA (MazF antagonist)